MTTHPFEKAQEEKGTESKGELLVKRILALLSDSRTKMGFLLKVAGVAGLALYATPAKAQGSVPDYEKYLFCDFKYMDPTECKNPKLDPKHGNAIESGKEVPSERKKDGEAVAGTMGEAERLVMNKASSVLTEHLLNPFFMEANEKLKEALATAINNPKMKFVENGGGIEITKRPSANSSIAQDFKIEIRDGRIISTNGIKPAEFNGDDWKTIADKFAKYSEEKIQSLSSVDGSMDPDHKKYLETIRFGLDKLIVDLLDSAEGSRSLVSDDLRVRSKEHKKGKGRLDVIIKKQGDGVMIKIVTPDEGNPETAFEPLLHITPAGVVYAKDENGKLKPVNGNNVLTQPDNTKQGGQPVLVGKTSATEAIPAPSTNLEGEEFTDEKPCGQKNPVGKGSFDEICNRHWATFIKSTTDKPVLFWITSSGNPEGSAQLKKLQAYQKGLKGNVVIAQLTEGNSYFTEGKAKLGLPENASNSIYLKNAVGELEKTDLVMDKAGRPPKKILENIQKGVAPDAEKKAQWIDNFMKNTSILQPLLPNTLSPSAKSSIMSFVNENMQEKWFKDGLNRIKTSVAQGSFHKPENSPGGYFNFKNTYFPDMPVLKWGSIAMVLGSAI